MRTHKMFPLEIDHIYIWVTEGGTEATYLQSYGLYLLDGITNHEGQGTSSRFYMFRNMCLEFIWISDRMAMTQQAKKVGEDAIFLERRGIDESPFGIAFHHRVDSTRIPPVQTLKYHSEWMPPSTWIDVVPRISVYEPTYFIMPDDLAYTSLEDECNHPLGLKNLSHIRITIIPKQVISPMGEILTNNGILQIQNGLSPLMELTFDNGMRGNSIDCRPILPLIIHY